MAKYRSTGMGGRLRLILACGDVDSWAPSSEEQDADIPLYFSTFLQLDVSEGRTQHESGSASFGISRPFDQWSCQRACAPLPRFNWIMEYGLA